MLGRPVQQVNAKLRLSRSADRCAAPPSRPRFPASLFITESVPLGRRPRALACPGGLRPPTGRLPPCGRPPFARHCAALRCTAAAAGCAGRSRVQLRRGVHRRPLRAVRCRRVPHRRAVLCVRRRVGGGRDDGAVLPRHRRVHGHLARLDARRRACRHAVDIRRAVRAAVGSPPNPTRRALNRPGGEGETHRIGVFCANGVCVFAVSQVRADVRAVQAHAAPVPAPDLDADVRVCDRQLRRRHPAHAVCAWRSPPPFERAPVHCRRPSPLGPSPLTPVPTYGLFPLAACSRLRPIPTYGRFPLTAGSRLRPIPCAPRVPRRS